jgi:hypothetical protein
LRNCSTSLGNIGLLKEQFGVANVHVNGRNLRHGPNNVSSETCKPPTADLVMMVDCSLVARVLPVRHRWCLLSGCLTHAQQQPHQGEERLCQASEHTQHTHKRPPNNRNIKPIGLFTPAT